MSEVNFTYKFDKNQPRDKSGKWSSGKGGGGSREKDRSKDSPKASAKGVRAKAKSAFTKDELSLPDKKRQPWEDFDEIFENAPLAKRQFDRLLNEGDGVAEKDLGAKKMNKGPDDVTAAEFAKPGAMLFLAPNKAKDGRATEKVRDKYKGDASQLTDVVRGSIAFDTLDEMYAAPEKLRKGGVKVVTKPNDSYLEPRDSGYADVALSIEMPNGMVAELQLHTKEMIKAKNTGHKDYEITRKIEEGAKKSGRKYTPQEKRQLEESYGRMTKLYNKAKRNLGISPPDYVLKEEDSVGHKETTYYKSEGVYFKTDKGEPKITLQYIRHKGKWLPYRPANPQWSDTTLAATKVSREEAEKS